MREYGGSITIAICDDHAVVRSALRALLESEPGFVVVGEAASADEAVRELQRSQPDVLLLDISMPRRTGLEALPELLEASPRTSIVIVSFERARALQQAAFALGARGFVSKDEPAEILSAVWAAARTAGGPAETARERRTGRDRRAGVERRLIRTGRPPGIERRVADRRSAVDRRSALSPADAR